MATIDLELERLLGAERLLMEIERRHAFERSAHQSIDSSTVDRYLVAYVPQTQAGSPAPQAPEYAFTHSLAEAFDLLRRVLAESPDGSGAAVYVHDLDILT